MMESNCEMKTTNMKTQSTQSRKEIFNDSFFIRKSIITDVVDNEKQKLLPQIIMNQGKSSVLTIRKKILL